MIPLAEVLMKSTAGSNIGPPQHRRFPCERCGVEIGAPYTLCRSCLTTWVAQRRDERLRPARESIPAKHRVARFSSPNLFAWVQASDRAIARAQAVALSGEPLVVIVGASGTGKTTLACAMLADAIERGGTVDATREELAKSASCRFTEAYDLSMARKEHQLGREEPPSIATAKAAHVLVLDEFGRDDRSGGSDVPRILHDRESKQQSTIVTTWLSQEELAAMYDGGTARRLYEGVVIRLGAVK